MKLHWILRPLALIWVLKQNIVDFFWQKHSKFPRSMLPLLYSGLPMSKMWMKQTWMLTIIGAGGGGLVMKMKSEESTDSDMVTIHMKIVLSVARWIHRKNNWPMFKVARSQNMISIGTRHHWNKFPKNGKLLFCQPFCVFQRSRTWVGNLRFSPQKMGGGESYPSGLRF